MNNSIRDRISATCARMSGSCAQGRVRRPEVFSGGHRIDGHGLGHAEVEHDLGMLIGFRRLIERTAEVRHGADGGAPVEGDAGGLVQRFDDPPLTRRRQHARLGRDALRRPAGSVKKLRRASVPDFPLER